MLLTEGWEEKQLVNTLKDNVHYDVQCKFPEYLSQNLGCLI